MLEYFRLLRTGFCVLTFWKGGCENLTLQLRDSIKQMHRGVVDNALGDEVGRDNHGPSESRPVTKDCLASPTIRILAESDTCLYFRRSGSMLGAYCGSTTIRKVVKRLPSTLPFDPSTMKSRKQFVV